MECTSTILPKLLPIELLSQLKINTYIHLRSTSSRFILKTFFLKQICPWGRLKLDIENRNRSKNWYRRSDADRKSGCPYMAAAVSPRGLWLRMHWFWFWLKIFFVKNLEVSKIIFCILEKIAFLLSCYNILNRESLLFTSDVPLLSTGLILQARQKYFLKIFWKS